MDGVTLLPWSEVVDYTVKCGNARVTQILKTCQTTGRLKFSHIRELLASDDTGLKTFELSGHIGLGTPGDLSFYVNTSAVGYDLHWNRPVSVPALNGLAPIWHLHPANTMPYKFPQHTGFYMSNFFSEQDVDFCISHPMTISVIFNKESVSDAFPFPCIYVFMFVPHLDEHVPHGAVSPTDGLLRVQTSYQRHVVPLVIQKIENFTTTQTDCEIDWPRIVEEFRRRRIVLRYLYHHDEFELDRILRELKGAF